MIKGFMSRFKIWVKLDQKGQGMTEYLTLLVLVSLVAVGAASRLGKTIKGKLETADRSIQSKIRFRAER